MAKYDEISRIIRGEAKTQRTLPGATAAGRYDQISGIIRQGSTPAAPAARSLSNLAPAVQTLPPMGTVATLIAQQKPELVRPTQQTPARLMAAKFVQGATAGLVTPEAFGVTRQPETTAEKAGAIAAEIAGWVLPIGLAGKITAPVATAVRGVRALRRAAPAVGRMVQMGAAGALATVPQQAREMSAGKPMAEAAKAVGEQAAVWAGMEAVGLALAPFVRRIWPAGTVAPKVEPTKPKPMLALPPGTKYEAGLRPQVLRPESGTARLSRVLEEIRAQVPAAVKAGREPTVGPGGLMSEIGQALGYDLEREFRLAEMPFRERLKALAEDNPWSRLVSRTVSLRRHAPYQAAYVRELGPTVGTAQLTTPGVMRAVEPGTPEWLAAIEAIAGPESRKAGVKEAARLAGRVAEAAASPTRVPEAIAAGYERYGDLREFANRVLSSVEGWLASKGQGGQEIIRMAREAEMIADQQIAKWTAEMIERVAHLTQAERVNLRDVVRGLAQPANERVAEAARAVNAYYTDRAQRIAGVGLTLRTSSGQDIPFQPAERHFPLRLDWAKLEDKTGNFRPDVLQRLVDSGQAKDVLEADRLLRLLRSRPYERHATFQHEAERLQLPEFEIDPLLALRSDVLEGETRIAQALVWGPNDERLLRAVESLHPKDRPFAIEVVNRLRGVGPQATLERHIIEGLLSYNVLTKLGLAAIPNATQTLNTALKLGVKQLVRGVRSAVANKQEAIEFARAAGIHLDPSNIARVIAETRGGLAPLTAGFMRATGFTATEFWNRLITSQAARGWAEDMFRALQRPGSVSWVRRVAGTQPARIRRLLSEAGVDVDAALARGALSPEDLYRVSRWVVQRTQFPASMMDVPLWASSPWGRVLFQFKRYAFNQGRLLKRELLDEAVRFFRSGGREGSLRAWGPFLVLFPSAGWVVGAIRDWISGKETPTQKLARISETVEKRGALAALIEEMIDAYTWVGGLGILTDTIRQLQYGEERILSELLGPSTTVLSDVATVAHEVLAAGQRAWAGEDVDAEQRMRRVIRAIVRNVPVVGPALVRGQLPFGIEWEPLQEALGPRRER